ncbi:hypothetical protein [Amycolatopsis sp. NPDC003731]
MGEWLERDRAGRAGDGAEGAKTPGVLAGFDEVVALIETALGVERAGELAAVPSVRRLAFGSVGLAAQLGVAPEDRDPFVYARSLGFGGKLCLHPRQLGPVRDGFALKEAERAWARRVLAAGDGVSAVDGRMVDKPVLTRTRHIPGADEPLDTSAPSRTTK